MTSMSSFTHSGSTTQGLSLVSSESRSRFFSSSALLRLQDPEQLSKVQALRAATKHCCSSILNSLKFAPSRMLVRVPSLRMSLWRMSKIRRRVGNRTLHRKKRDREVPLTDVAFRKKFSFRLEVTPAFCIVSHILSIGISQALFMNEFTSVRQIFQLYIPPERESLHIKWKSQLLDQPFFCNVKSSSIGTGISREEAFPYAKLQQTFVRLGLLAGFKMRLELYSLRRGSGRNINSKSALDSVSLLFCTSL
jgi:hypothetical protein